MRRPLPQLARFPARIDLHTLKYPQPSSPSSINWYIEPCFWSRRRVQVTEVIDGSAIWSATGWLTFSGAEDVMYITGKRRSERARLRTEWSLDKLHRQTESHVSAVLDRFIILKKAWPPRYKRLNSAPVQCYAVRESHEETQQDVVSMDFRLKITKDLPEELRRIGYFATGTLEYGCSQLDNWSVSYYALMSLRPIDQTAIKTTKGRFMRFLSQL